MQRIKNRLPYLLCYITAFVVGMKQLREPDVWWQLLSGRWMLEHRQVTHTDVFSFSMQGHSWVNVKWLYEILIALLEKIMGPLGVIFLQGAVNVTIVYLLFRCFALLGKHLQQPAYEFLSVISVILFLAVVEYRMAGRPEMVSHLMFTLFLFIMLKAHKADWKNVGIIIALQCLWANMHEGYPVGLVLIASFWAGTVLVWIIKKDKFYLQQSLTLTGLLALSVLALLLNPNGFQLWKQPFEIYNQVLTNKFTTELYSVANPEYWTIEAKVHIVLLSLVILYWIRVFIKAARNKALTTLLDPSTSGYILLIALFGYLSLTANRNIPFAQIVIFPSLPAMFAWIISILKVERLKIYSAIRTQAAWIASIIVILFYLSIVSNSFYKTTGSVNRYGIHISMHHNPTGVANFIKEHHVKGPAFSDYFISSYLLWSLYPDFRSYIDLRDLDVFPAPFFKQYFELYHNKELFKALDDKYKFNYVVLSTSQLVNLQLHLYWDSGFNMIYVDPVSALFLRQVDSNTTLNAVIDFQKFSWPPAPNTPVWANALTKLFNPLCSFPEEDEKRKPIHEALFLNQMQNYPDAINALLPKVSTIEDDAQAYATLGNIYMQYARVTKERALRRLRADSANNFFEMAKEAK